MSGGGRADPQAQQEFAKKWLKLQADYWEFREEKN